ncbi:hypothetical protein ABEB36_005530 [Hypothenemus hampei]|uniref:Uncharacterized protein n=1 Tax=Hypothenemus hampei TaxID=57062 RepID=A0ABD1EYI1_HYPHA
MAFATSMDLAPAKQKQTTKEIRMGLINVKTSYDINFERSMDEIASTEKLRKSTSPAMSFTRSIDDGLWRSREVLNVRNVSIC